LASKQKKLYNNLAITKSCGSLLPWRQVGRLRACLHTGPLHFVKEVIRCLWAVPGPVWKPAGYSHVVIGTVAWKDAFPPVPGLTDIGVAPKIHFPCLNCRAWSWWVVNRGWRWQVEVGQGTILTGVVSPSAECTERGCLFRWLAYNGGWQAHEVDAFQGG